MKFQIPSIKSQISTNIRKGMFGFGILEIGDGLEFGNWDLGFEASRENNT
jgi:hypothetical protein